MNFRGRRTTRTGGTLRTSRKGNFLATHSFIMAKSKDYLPISIFLFVTFHTPVPPVVAHRLLLVSYTTCKSELLPHLFIKPEFSHCPGAEGGGRGRGGRGEGG